MFNLFGNQGGTATIDHPVMGMNGQNRLPDCPPNVIPQHYGNVVAPNGALINNIPGAFLGNIGAGYANAVNPGYWNAIPCPTIGYGSVVPSNAAHWPTINPGLCNSAVGTLPNAQPLGWACPTPFLNNCTPTMQFGVPNGYPVNYGMPISQPYMPAFAGLPNFNGTTNQTAIPTNYPPISPVQPWVNNVPVNTSTPFMPNYNGVCGTHFAYQPDLNSTCATTPVFATGLPNNFPIAGLNSWNTPTYGPWANAGNLAYNTVPNITGTGWNMANPNACRNDWNLPTWNMGYPNTVYNNAYNATNGFNPFFFGHGGAINNPWNTINNPLNVLNHPINSQWNGIGSVLPTFQGHHGFATHPTNNYGALNPCNTIGNFGPTGHPTGGVYNPGMMNPTHVGTWPIGNGLHSGFGVNAFYNTPYGFNSVPVNPLAYGSTCCN